MKNLHVSPDLALPADIVASTGIVYGGKGMGKTNLLSIIMEELARAGLLFAALDPMGVLWGLRFDVSGKGPGVEVLILGGIHGDIPIEPTGGAVVADLVVENDVSVIIDISRRPDGSMWAIAERVRFVTDYCKRLYQRQGEKRRPLLQLIDEAARFVPQTVRKGDEQVAACIGAVTVLVEEGRNVGIGCWLFTQRSARLNKDVAELADAMVAFRTGGPNSRRAVLDWLGEHVEAEHIKEYDQKLRSLDRGTALVVSPGWLGFEGFARFHARKTFDSSATPKPGESQKKVSGGAKPDLAKYEARMKETIERAQAEDPRALKKRIRELEAQLAKGSDEAAIGALKARIVELEAREPEIREVHVLTEAQLKRIEKIGDVLLTGAAEAQLAAKELRELAKAAGATQQETSNDTVRHRPARLNPSTIERPAPATSPARRDGARAALGVAETQRPSPPPPSATGLKPSQLRLLEAAAVADGLTPRQLAIRCGYTPDGGGFNNLMYSLTGSGHLERRGPRIYVTDAGAAAVPHARKVGPAEFREVWRGKLKPSQWKLLAAVIDRYPAAIHPDELAEATGYTPGTGGFNNLMYSLTGAGLLEKDADGLRPTEDLVG